MKKIHICPNFLLALLSEMKFVHKRIQMIDTMAELQLAMLPSVAQEQFNGNLQCISNMMGHSHKVREKNHAAL